MFGRDAWKEAVEIHKRIAYVPGDVNLWLNLTGGEVIDLFVNLRGSHNKALRECLIRDFNLDPTKKCRTYSKGITPALKCCKISGEDFCCCARRIFAGIIAIFQENLARHSDKKTVRKVQHLSAGVIADKKWL